jgi:hypothetical protein
MHAQDGQSGANANWPCVPGRAVDSAYLNISESTGGQLFLFQKNEVAHASVVMNAGYTHPATVLRSIGNLNGTRDMEFAIESGVESLLLLASLQCRNSILLYRPDGSELTERYSAQNIDLQAGRIMRIDHPEPGPWRVHLAGRGLFVLSVLAKADNTLDAVSFSSTRDASNGDERAIRIKNPLLGVQQNLEIRVTGQVSDLKLQLVNATGDRLSETVPLDPAGDGLYVARLTPQTERFRVLVTGTDRNAWPFQRMFPVLFKAEPRK